MPAIGNGMLAGVRLGGLSDRAGMCRLSSRQRRARLRVFPNPIGVGEGGGNETTLSKTIGIDMDHHAAGDFLWRLFLFSGPGKWEDTDLEMFPSAPIIGMVPFA